MAKKKYDVYGVGNALVDIVTEVTDDFFAEHNIKKGWMTLVDEPRQRELMNAIRHNKYTPMGGGSAGNTVVAISQLGGKTFYECVVAKDELGKFFLTDLAENGVDTATPYDARPEGITGRCLVMTSKDAQRTMNTFLGISSTITPAHLHERVLSQSDWLYLEGYLAASDNGMETMRQACQWAKRHNTKIAFTFSDASMVNFFRPQVQQIMALGVDFLFCNEEEAMLYTKVDDREAAALTLRQVVPQFALTRGAQGALLWDGTQNIRVVPYPQQAVDTTGAGDMFAGAFLYAITQGYDFAVAGNLASLASSAVVAQYGPRLTLSQMDAFKVQCLR